MSSLAK